VVARLYRSVRLGGRKLLSGSTGDIAQVCSQETSRNTQVRQFMHQRMGSLTLIPRGVTPANVSSPARGGSGVTRL
jgi:hypothetical protein